MTKAILGIFCIAFLCGCAQTSFLGPIYTLTSTGNVYHAGISYGSDRVITTITGKSPGENIKDLIVKKKEDSEFNKLVKKKLKKLEKN
ncbi:hypothetical protein N9S20_02680 [Candidatus Pelagibacter sp.]|nr:hypothetical protein [Candidatus Pelagibacter sp.]